MHNNNLFRFTCLTQCLTPTSAPSGRLTRHIITIIVIIIMIFLLNQAVNSNIRYNGNGYLPCNGFVPCQVIILSFPCLIVQRCQAQVQVPIPCSNKPSSPKQFCHGGICTKIKGPATHLKYSS